MFSFNPMNFTWWFFTFAKLLASVLWSDRDKSSVCLCMVQRNIRQSIIRTSSLALACCLAYPQICLISAHLSGSHWALRWAGFPRDARDGTKEGIVFLAVRTLSLPVLLLPSNFSFLLLWSSSGCTLAVTHLPGCSSQSHFGSLVCQFPWMLLSFGKENDQITGLFRTLRRNSSIQSSHYFTELILICTLVSQYKSY